jgi:hypothetical protein
MTLNMTLIALEMRERIDKCDCIRLKSFCMQKEQLVEWRDSLHNGRKSLPESHPVGLISRIYREIKKYKQQK